MGAVKVSGCILKLRASYIISIRSQVFVCWYVKCVPFANFYLLACEMCTFSQIRSHMKVYRLVELAALMSVLMYTILLVAVYCMIMSNLLNS